MTDLDLLADEPPPTGKKASSDHGGGSAVGRVLWLVAVASIGFSATWGVFLFGPRALESFRSLTAPSPGVARRSGPARPASPWAPFTIAPLRDLPRTPTFPESPIPPIRIPPGQGLWDPNAAGRGDIRGFSIHR